MELSDRTVSKFFEGEHRMCTLSVEVNQFPLHENSSKSQRVSEPSLQISLDIFSYFLFEIYGTDRKDNNTNLDKHKQ